MKKNLEASKIYLSGYYPKEEYQRVKEGLEESKKMAEERKRLEEACKSKIVGYRNHYLRFDRNLTWQALSQNDFLYDLG